MITLNLENKVAIVTGSTRGIGRAIALILAENGALVFVNGQDKTFTEKTVKEWSNKGFKVYGLAGDVSDEQFVKRFIQGVFEKAGRVDILVNNAGISEWQFLEDLSSQSWDRYIDINLKSNFLMCREVSSMMKKQKSGKIINISSVAGIRGRVGGVHYVASKSGQIGLTKALAKELGPFNIQVNAVAPGLTDTDLSRSISTQIDAFFSGSKNTEISNHNHSQKVFDERAHETPLKRVAEPIDIAKVVLFLASPLSDFITGQVLVVDGGSLM